MEQLAPCQPLGLFPQFCAPQQIVLILKENVLSFSGDDFIVKDQFDNVVIKCEGHTFSVAQRKQFLDSAGRELFELKDKMFHIHKTMVAEAPDGKELMAVKQKWHLHGSEMDAAFVDFDGSEVLLVCKGDFFGHGYFAASAEWSRVSAIFQYIIARHRHTIAAYPYTTAASPTRIAAALLSCRRGSTALVA
ncbi:tubby C-terminal-like domain-containing protein [Roridomyces roridus]|uniref:Tubby C-terminal-like domain-containing protein n=1 Tax=Roridomyces roridus TaxID=1738132 RepID=A0AAD7FIT2_9AGAR|nr:tubby C-terminal-like domain-containing protein [Roridomyces roridus]